MIPNRAGCSEVQGLCKLPHEGEPRKVAGNPTPHYTREHKRRSEGNGVAR